VAPIDRDGGASDRCEERGIDAPRLVRGRARGLVTFITKNGHNRTTPLHATLKTALEALPDREGPVFRGSDGQRVGKSALRYAFEAAVRKAGLVPFRFHDCRHAAISFLVQAGVPLATVQMIGGWTTIGMVLRYGHLAPQHLKVPWRRCQRSPRQKRP